MVNVPMTKEQYEFLKNLQAELRTQENDGNADPVFWGVIETRLNVTAEGCGDPKIFSDDGIVELEEAVAIIDDEVAELDEDTKDRWNDVDRRDVEDVFDFIKYDLEWNNYDLYWYEERDALTTDTGAFLTKNACKQYIEKYGYNHNNPRTYAMTAYRNFEYGNLLKVLKSIDLGNDE